MRGRDHAKVDQLPGTRAVPLTAAPPGGQMLGSAFGEGDDAVGRVHQRKIHRAGHRGQFRAGVRELLKRLAEIGAHHRADVISERIGEQAEARQAGHRAVTEARRVISDCSGHGRGVIDPPGGDADRVNGRGHRLAAIGAHPADGGLESHHRVVGGWAQHIAGRLRVYCRGAHACRDGNRRPGAGPARRAVGRPRVTGGRGVVESPQRRPFPAQHCRGGPQQSHRSRRTTSVSRHTGHLPRSAAANTPGAPCIQAKSRALFRRP